MILTSTDDYTFEELYKLQILWAEECFGRLTLEDKDRVNSTWEMLHEELTELSQAETHEKILDAIADLFVVFCQLHHLYVESQEDSEPTQILYARSTLYAKNMVDVSISKFLHKMNIAIKREDKQELVSYLLPYWTRLADYAETLGMEVAEAIVEVTESNWSKLAKLGDIREKYPDCDTIEEALQKECEWIQENYSIAKDVKAVISDTMRPGEEGDEDAIRVRFLNQGGKGKLLKHSGYFKPDLKQYVKQ